jgi:hypothetical protein
MEKGKTHLEKRCVKGTDSFVSVAVPETNEPTPPTLYATMSLLGVRNWRGTKHKLHFQYMRGFEEKFTLSFSTKPDAVAAAFGINQLFAHLGFEVKLTRNGDNQKEWVIYE